MNTKLNLMSQFVFQSLTHVQLFVTSWTAAHQASLSFTISWSLLKFMSIESVMLYNHLILCRPLLFLPSIFPSIRFFLTELALHIRWPKYWSISFSINPSKEYSGLISFRTDWFDLLAVQGVLKNLLQNHNSKASSLWHLAFFMVQLLHLYMITGKKSQLWLTWTFVSKVMSLVFNTMDYSPLGSSASEMFQARILKWGAISYSKESSRSRDQTHVSWVSCIGRLISLPLAPHGNKQLMQQERIHLCEMQPWGMDLIQGFKAKSTMAMI